MIEQIFQVATEFRFDVGKAMLNTNALTDAVGELSTASNSALRSLTFLASGLAARIGLGSGGILTLLGKAVSLAEDLDHTALNFSGTIFNNMSVLTGTIGTFNDRLETSHVLIEGIADIANKFAIPTSQLASMSNLLAPSLARHNKLGRNFAGSTEMAKNLILGADTLQMNPAFAAESLQRAMGGDHMPLPGKLFQRLVNTDAFSKAGIKTQPKFMALDASKKIDLLDKALKNVAGDTDALNFRLGSLHGQFTILQNLFMDIGSILTPVGKALRKPIVDILKGITDYLKTHGKAAGEELGKIITRMVAHPQKLLLDIAQASKLKSNVHSGLKAVEIFGIFNAITFGLDILKKWADGSLKRSAFEWVQGRRRARSAIMLGAGAAPEMGILGSIMSFAPIKIFLGVFRVIGLALLEVIPVFAIVTFWLQVFARARALARINDAKALADLGPAKVLIITNKLQRALSNLIFPITFAIDKLAQMISRFFEWNQIIKMFFPNVEAAVNALDRFGIGIVKLTGIIFAAMQTQNEMTPSGAARVGMGTLLHPIDAFWRHYNDFLKDNKERMGGDDMKATANYVTNIGTQNVRFDMREQLEPDRIAFAVTDHLKRLASNPTQGRGNSFRKLSAGSVAAAGRQ